MDERNRPMTNPRAVVYEDLNGNLVLDDPDALAVARAVGKHNCRLTLALNAERAEHFVRRIKERGLGPRDAVVVIINVDDPHGAPIAEALMPGQDWQAFRDRGEVPFARGLAVREGIEGAVALFDQEAAAKLRADKGPSIVVIDHGVAEIFGAEEISR